MKPSQMEPGEFLLQCAKVVANFASTGIRTRGFTLDGYGTCGCAVSFDSGFAPNLQDVQEAADHFDLKLGDEIVRSVYGSGPVASTNSAEDAFCYALATAAPVVQPVVNKCIGPGGPHSLSLLLAVLQMNWQR